MKKFSFTLQKVLNLREFDENQAKEELGRVIGIANSLQAELEQIAKDRYANRSSTGNLFNAQDFLAIEHYVTRLDIRKEEVLVELAQTELLIEQKREIFTEAMKNRKVLTKLKEKQLLEWKKNTMKEEEQNIDDITNAKYLSEKY